MAGLVSRGPILKFIDNHCNFSPKQQPSVRNLTTRTEWLYARAFCHNRKEAMDELRTYTPVAFGNKLGFIRVYWPKGPKGRRPRLGT